GLAPRSSSRESKGAKDQPSLSGDASKNNRRKNNFEAQGAVKPRNKRRQGEKQIALKTNQFPLTQLSDESSGSKLHRCCLSEEFTRTHGCGKAKNADRTWQPRVTVATQDRLILLSPLPWQRHSQCLRHCPKTAR